VREGWSGESGTVRGGEGRRVGWGEEEEEEEEVKAGEVQEPLKRASK
jgi:hypothetical protein